MSILVVCSGCLHPKRMARSQSCRHRLRCERCHAGLGRADEAELLLRSSHAALRDAFGDDFEAVGEASFYLTLIALGMTQPQDIYRLNGQLHKARWWL